MAVEVDRIRLRLTVIAPEAPGLPPLAWLTEIGGLCEIEGVDVTVVGGPQVNRAAVARGLGRPADVVIWSGHGRESGLLLADGSLATGKWIATQVRCGAPRLLVLAACGSGLADGRLESLTAAVSRAGVNVVGFPLQAADRAAVIYNVELVRALAAGADVGAAHEVALEGVATDYPDVAQGITLTPGLTNGKATPRGYSALLGRLEALEGSQRRLEARLALIARHLGIE
jgi:hypothetical protein